jgi:hypothetical protein
MEKMILNRFNEPYCSFKYNKNNRFLKKELILIIVLVGVIDGRKTY